MKEKTETAWHTFHERMENFRLHSLVVNSYEQAQLSKKTNIVCILLYRLVEWKRILIMSFIHTYPRTSVNLANVHAQTLHAHLQHTIEEISHTLNHVYFIEYASVHIFFQIHFFIVVERILFHRLSMCFILTYWKSKEGLIRLTDFFICYLFLYDAIEYILRHIVCAFAENHTLFFSPPFSSF